MTDRPILPAAPLVILSPLRPRNLSAWERWPTPPAFPNGAVPHSLERWVHKTERFSVLTAVEAVDFDPDKPDELRPEYHISICRLALTGTARVDNATALDVLRMFDAEGFLEDNHVPHGKVRNFWRPVAGDFVGQRCRCEADEPKIVEDRGDFIWRG